MNLSLNFVETNVAQSMIHAWFNRNETTAEKLQEPKISETKLFENIQKVKAIHEEKTYLNIHSA